MVAAYAELVPPGSLFAVSCGRVDDPALRDQLSEAHTAAPVFNHSRKELVDPGLVPVQSWHDARVTPPGPAYVLAGVALKPR